MLDLCVCDVFYPFHRVLEGNLFNYSFLFFLSAKSDGGILF